jgi:CRISPR-associated helicase Cas3
LKYTQFQTCVQNKLKEGKSILLIAPTGLGKTLAVTGDIQDKFCKTIYSVPLRALGSGIKQELLTLRRNGNPIQPVIHHGDIQESQLFGEEVIITTYDQVVCGVPGLPLSLPLKAGHAVAGALLMSRLILDEAHLAWGISDKALSILLAIIDFRQKLNLQTVILTATLPNQIAKKISERLGLDLIVVGEGEIIEDEAFKQREVNRQVTISTLELENIGRGDNKHLDWQTLDEKLLKHQGKHIYFANTVERLHETYDRLVNAGMDTNNITILHNRMPRTWRIKAEEQAHKRFGKDSLEGNWLLLTNQVAEAGLDISAPLVISDPAPVDTLVQRAGRCARWFRSTITNGQFFVIKAPKTDIDDKNKGLAIPYRPDFVHSALKYIPNTDLNWSTEKAWINDAWGGDSKKALSAIDRSLSEITFALNLFDRAAQEQRPGEIAGVFREILSVDVAVEEGNSVYLDDLAERDLQIMLMHGQYPEASSISLGRAWKIVREVPGKCAVIRYDEDGKLRKMKISSTDSVRPGDVLVVPSIIAYLHEAKGLCFGDGNEVKGAILSSNWLNRKLKSNISLHKENGKRQTLWEHTTGVMKGVIQRFTEDGIYRKTLLKILLWLEPGKNEMTLSNLITALSALAAGFHDLGKSDKRWQNKAREIDPESAMGLIGRTANIDGQRIGIPHTLPAYNATIKACELLIGNRGSSDYLIRAIAIAAARHHSSMLNPALTVHKFDPDPRAIEFIKSVLTEVKASAPIIDRAHEILDAAKEIPSKDNVPLLLPNVDLFPLYVLIGRAILMADREDAAGEPLEQWRI